MDLSPSTRDARDQRPLIFIAVLVFHAAFVWLAIRTARLPMSASASVYEPLILLLLPHKPHVQADATPRRPTDPRHSTASKSRASEPQPTTSNAITIAPEPPKIDWEREAELAAKNSIANAAKENGYRNLSALSPEQLSWVRRNHMEPVRPGIAWTYRRVEITEGGFPIIHINDHCVAIPLLMMMVFCQIGHIEPKGDLFKHMRGPRSP